MRTHLLALVLFAAACQQGKSKLDDDRTAPVHAVGSNAHGSGSAAPDTSIDINSKASGSKIMNPMLTQ